MEAYTLDRIQFAFTITYHYLFPQLTMGLAPLIVIFKTLAIWKKDERWNHAAGILSTLLLPPQDSGQRSSESRFCSAW